MLSIRTLTAMLLQVRYRPGEKFTWHLDALPPTPELASNGGQRIATLLVYLTDLPEGDGGATAFRDLGPLRVRPCKVSGVLWAPRTAVLVCMQGGLSTDGEY